MKNKIPKDTDVFTLLPNITEEEAIRFLSKVAALAYKKESFRWKFTIAVNFVVLSIYLIVGLGCIYHKEYLMLIYIILSAMLITCIYKIVAKSIKQSKLSYLFIDNKQTEINSYDNTDRDFMVNFKNKTAQSVHNVQSAFLISAYIMLAFKDNSIAIIKPDKEDREKILDVVYSVDSRITSYDRTPQNMLWMKKYYKKIVIKMLVPALILCLLHTVMKLTIW